MAQEQRSCSGTNLEFPVLHCVSLLHNQRDLTRFCQREVTVKQWSNNINGLNTVSRWLVSRCFRYRVIHYGMWIMWFGAMLNGFSLVIGKVIEDYGAHIDPWVSLFAKVIMGLGLGVFQANIIQFGIDQLIDASSVEITHCVVYYCHFHFWHNHVFQQLVCTRICSNSSHSSVSVTGHWLRFSCRSLADKGTNRQKPIASDTESCSLHN